MRSGGFGADFFFRRDFRGFWKEKSPVGMEFASGASLNGEWTEAEAEGN